MNTCIAPSSTKLYVKKFKSISYVFKSLISSKMAEIIVEVKQGKLQGAIKENVQGGNYYAFHGIPYAKPPVGELRFKAPKPLESWEGIWDATKEGNVCYSRDMFLRTLKGSEDCLVLNVYTCELPNASIQPKPVMVWIHGGAFIHGSGEIAVYGPDYLLKEDVVVVTINYRTGALGFLNFEDPSLEVPGNAGLKDMVMALKWIKQNISAFNGDPNNVTIFGESAGGAAVHLLTLSPMGKGLFHRAIAQSGSALNPWSWGRPSAELFAESLEIKDWNEKKVLDILRTLPVETLYKAQEKIKDHFRCNEKRPFGPVVEKSSEKEAFLTEEPLELIKSGNYNKVPFMTGYTSREGMLYAAEYVFSDREIKLPNDFEETIPYSLNLPKGSAKSKSVAAQIKQFYFGDQMPTQENMQSTYMLYTDAFFFRGIFETVKEQFITTDTPIYLYRFSVDADMNILKKLLRISEPGASHADELAYLFRNSFFSPSIKANSIEDLTRRRMCKLWATFARNADPNFKASNDVYNVVWKPVNKNQLNYLEIGENVTVGVNPDAARMIFWDKIFGQGFKL